MKTQHKMKNLTTPKRKSGEKSTVPSCSLSASATSEGTSIQDTLLAFQANHKALVKHVVQVASSLSEVHRQLNQLCTRSILNEKRIDSLEEGAAKMSVSICDLNKKLLLASNEVEGQQIPQISDELEDQTNRQISAELEDQTSCESSAELEDQTSHQMSAGLEDPTNHHETPELEDQTSCLTSAEFEDQTSRHISSGVEDHTSRQINPEFEDQSSRHFFSGVEDHTSHQRNPEFEEQTNRHVSSEVEDHTSHQRNPEFEEQISRHVSSGLEEDHISHQRNPEFEEQISRHGSSGIEDHISHQRNPDFEEQISRHVSSGIEDHISHQRNPEFEEQTSSHISFGVKDHSSHHRPLELEEQISRQISFGIKEHTSHQRTSEFEEQSSCQTSPEKSGDQSSCQSGHETEDETMLQSPAGFANLSKDCHKIETDSSETSSTHESEERFDSFQVLQHRAEWNKLSSQQYSLSSFDNTKYCKPRSPVMQKIQSEEEELYYLQFVADVTNEILTLGLFSNRVLERVFERHVEQNRHRLDENKMRHLLHVLREDLGCNAEGPDNVDNGEIPSFLHQEKPKPGIVHDAVPRNKCREKTARRTKTLSGEQQKQMEQLLQKETRQEHNGTHSRQQYLSEGDQQELRSESVYQCTDRSMGPLSSDPGVGGLSSAMDPLSSDLYSELTQQDGDGNFQVTSLDVDNLSIDHEEKSDATQNLSDCATEPDSDLENLDEVTGMEQLERYFADSLSYCKNEDECPLDLSGGRRATPCNTTFAGYDSEGEQFFK